MKCVRGRLFTVDGLIEDDNIATLAAIAITFLFMLCFLSFPLGYILIICSLSSKSNTWGT